LSILPAALAIVLALVTRQVLIALVLGGWFGALVLAGWQPLAAFLDLGDRFLVEALADPDHAAIVLFTTILGGMVGVMSRGGMTEGLVGWLAGRVGGRRGGQTAAAGLGTVIFFDDYANTLLVGTTMRPLTDRLRISREKLAYVVDSTAAPVAGLAIVSTWVAGEIGYIQDGLDEAGIGGTSGDALAVFVKTIPYRFYVLWALLFVPLVAWLKRDFGPMLAVEKAAQSDQPEALPADDTQVTTAARDPLQPEEGAPRHWCLAVAPIAAALFLIVAYILLTGFAAVIGEGGDTPGWISVMGKGDSYTALVAGSAGGLLWAAALAWCWGEQSIKRITSAALRGARLMLPVLAILWLAWTLSQICDREYLGTGDYLGSLISERIAPWLLPTLVFAIASAVSFSTGTSWGTMAILTPLVIPVVSGLLPSQGAEAGTDHPIFLASVGSVLAGAIFGDHCSPISDTTILSAQASGCPLMAHVWTQLPYAVVVGVVAILAGTLPVGLGINVWLLLPLGVLVLGVWLMLVGRRS
jgi:Na+/H+ antiporter NhaC